MLQVHALTLGAYQVNCYIIHDEKSTSCCVIDPGYEADTILDKLSELGLTLEAILLTHGHFDHIWGCNKLRELSGVKVYAWEPEKIICEDPAMNVSEMTGRAITATVDEYIHDGAVMNIEGMEFKVIGTPGHTVGSCCFYFEQDGILISGDTLFEGSVGRCDFPTGSGAALSRSLKEKLMCLPDEVKVFPGHGDSTTIGEERRYNPYCA